MPVRVDAEMLRKALRTFRAAWRRILAFEIAFKLIASVLGAAASAAVLAWVELRSGGASVTNTDLVGFLARPLSILLLVVIVGGAASLVFLEQAVLLSILGGGRLLRGSVRESFKAAAATITGVVRLAGVCVGVVVAVLIVAAALLALIYKGLLSGHDINYYLSAKPPVFLVAAAIGGVVALAAVAVLLWLAVRWLLALSITVFEGGRPRQALAESAARVRGHRIRIALMLIVWHGAIALLWLLVGAAGRPLAIRALEAADGSTSRAVVTIVSLLALHGLGTAAASFLEWVGHALIVLHVYRETHPARAAAPLPDAATDGSRETPLERKAFAAQAPWLSGPVALMVAVGLLIAAFVIPACVFVSRLGRQEKIEVTAHRGASRVAPENTLSAVRAAIESRCEWAEIDVQETLDGVVVVLHDQDLMRLAGDPRRIAEMTYEEARKLDVGTKFDPKFAGERLPTLKETIDLARGKIRLNIELKYYGKGDPRLAPDVARILRDEKFERDCFVASLNYESLAEAHKEWPALRTAAIISARVGDPTRLDVHLLSMNAKLVNTRLLRSAHRRGKEVHVWTIDDSRLATRLMDLGVDNLITNDPALMVRLRDERGALSRMERLVLAFRVVLGASFETPAIEGPVPEL
jgi:glycerophosphoryl diester phosphodiesterase